MRSCCPDFNFLLRRRFSGRRWRACLTTTWNVGACRGKWWCLTFTAVVLAGGFTFPVLCRTFFFGPQLPFGFLVYSFLVDACMKLLAHVETEGLFRKSGSIVRLKALRVSDAWGWPCPHWELLTLLSPHRRSHSPLKRVWDTTGLCFVCSGQTGCRRGVPVHSSPLRRGRPGQAVLPGASRARAARRAAGGLSQGSAARQRGEDLRHHVAVLRAARQEPHHPPILFWLPPECVFKVAGCFSLDCVQQSFLVF